ncbi:hypothetical protein BD324DRAFT_618685 [Kockovaella imperatae]|uniref:DUF1746 domain-containing protein n=1 Tax=Kockovaella imperatae TaxID=4999 RepID=A0A1Y1UMC3_9TREE|nr:hypothetical protein BD324DRAFT_618685 [Kockovaella imperatae]ORX39159.1 hypothetical protein BD324DRAFT_618685 [Kockovaella imperatae]
MVYGPQRRHAVASLGSAIQTISLAQHLLTPSILILVARLLVQGQIAAASVIHPTRSLLSLFFVVTLLNMAAILLHMLDFASGGNGTKGMLLDFVGQARQASFTRILLMDLTLYILQLSALVVSYVNHQIHAHPDEMKITALPYDDLLLPNAQAMDLDEPEFDLESGLRKRRKGQRDGAEEIWLDDGDDANDEHTMSDRKRLLSSTSSPSSSASRIREPPLIFSLTLPHILNLVFRLPPPPQPRPSFAGGTPAPSPRTATRSLRSLSTSAPQPASSTRTLGAGASPVTPPARPRGSNEEPDGEETEDEQGDESPTQLGRSPRGAASLVPDVGRIPGDYWVDSDRSRGNGG